MSCPFDTTKDALVSYSGADVSAESQGLPKIVLVTTFTLGYMADKQPKEEIRSCNVCGSLWFISYDYPDHPPLAFTAERIGSKESLEKRAKVMQEGLEANLRDNIIVEDTFAESEKKLAELQEAYEHL
jgi:hypothetical protein